MPAYLWVELGTRVSGWRVLRGLGSSSCTLALGAWSRGFWWLGSKSRGSCGLERVLREPECWWMGLCPCSVSCLVCGILVLGLRVPLGRFLRVTPYTSLNLPAISTKPAACTLGNNKATPIPGGTRPLGIRPREAALLEVVTQTVTSLSGLRRAVPDISSSVLLNTGLREEHLLQQKLVKDVISRAPQGDHSLEWVLIPPQTCTRFKASEETFATWFPCSFPLVLRDEYLEITSPVPSPQRSSISPVRSSVLF